MDHAGGSRFRTVNHCNSSWEQSKISDRLKEIKAHCIDKSGRKLQKNAEPIREAVVNIKSTTTMADLRRLSDTLQKELKIEAFQIHIHRDEGKSRNELNHHAHIVFDWQDKDKGTTIKFNKQGLSQMQNIVSDVLKMERGVTSDKTHLKALQYKNQQEAEKLAFLMAKTAELNTKRTDLSKDIGKDIERLGAIKDEQNKELEKLEKLQGQNQNIETNAKAYIDTNIIGIVNKEKTADMLENTHLCFVFFTLSLSD
jgi:ABC-type enterochelin transport system substrate-binding protein